MNIDLNNLLLLAFKIFFVLGAIIYFIFSLVVVKQTTTMSKNVYDKFNSIIITFSYIHAIFAFFLIFVTYIVL